MCVGWPNKMLKVIQRVSGRTGIRTRAAWHQCHSIQVSVWHLKHSEASIHQGKRQTIQWTACCPCSRFLCDRWLYQHHWDPNKLHSGSSDCRHLNLAGYSVSSLNERQNLIPVPYSSGLSVSLSQEMSFWKEDMRNVFCFVLFLLLLFKAFLILASVITVLTYISSIQPPYVNLTRSKRFWLRC